MTSDMRIRAAVAIMALLLAAPANAAPKKAPTPKNDVQELLGGKGGQPVTIDARDAIEWRQDQKVYIARGAATARRGDVSISADVLQAHYRNGAGGKTEIWRVDAIGNVHIRSPKENVYGDKGVYHVDSGLFELTGDHLRIESDKQTVTARDKLEYNRTTRIARALGDATATEKGKKLRADVLIAHFSEGGNGKLALHRVEAIGNVVVTTPQDTVMAKRADYDAVKDIVTMSGNVRLTRGPNQLNGAVAEVNLKTGVSRLLAAPRGAGGGQPVRGLFVPGQAAAPSLDMPLPTGTGAGTKQNGDKNTEHDRQ